MKKCYLCTSVKDDDEFYKDITSKDGLSSKCKDCSRTFKAKGFRTKTEKRCSKCENVLPISAFDLNSVGDGYQTACKTCRSVVKILSKYGISMDEYSQLVEDSNGRCNICQEFAPLVVDHCHETNKVRGLLCNLCNLGLGHFRDKTDRLLAAAKYLG